MSWKKKLIFSMNLTKYDKKQAKNKMKQLLKDGKACDFKEIDRKSIINFAKKYKPLQYNNLVNLLESHKVNGTIIYIGKVFHFDRVETCIEKLSNNILDTIIEFEQYRTSEWYLEKRTKNFCVECHNFDGVDQYWFRVIENEEQWNVLYKLCNNKNELDWKIINKNSKPLYKEIKNIFQI